MEFHYRKTFGLSQDEMDGESWLTIQTNLKIMELMNFRQRMDEKLGAETVRRN